MLTIQDVLETNQMIQKNNLDVRTITMGISFLTAVPATARRCATTFTIRLRATASTW